MIQGVQINFQNRKWKYPNRKTNHFSHFQSFDQKTYFIYVSHLIQGVQISFENRKWNYPNRKQNYYCHFQASDQKKSFMKCFLFDPRGLKLVFKTGNRIIQTGNGTISPNSRPLVKKTSITKCSTFDPRSSNLIFKTGNGINQTGNGIISPTPGL